MNKLQYNQPRAQAEPQNLRPQLKLALENNNPFNIILKLPLVELFGKNGVVW